MSRTGPLAAVILSAGLSTRLPHFKPLLRLGGASLLARSASLFRQAGIEQCVAVTGCRAGEVAEEARALGLRPVFNPDFESGMFSSVRAGPVRSAAGTGRGLCAPRGHPAHPARHPAPTH